MLLELLKQEEGKTLEFKENAGSLGPIIRTIVAFANTSGGTLVIGVRNGVREIVGVERILKEEERLASAIAESIAPLFMPDIEIHSLDDKELLVIRVPHVVGPYYLKAKGKAEGVYVRLGSTNRMADRDTVKAIERLSENVWFDELPCVGTSAADLDLSSLDEALVKEGLSTGSEQYKSLGVMTPHVGKLLPSNGAILLFGRDRQRWFPDAMVRCVRFAGTDRDTILDRREITGHLPNALSTAIDFVEQHTVTGAVIGRVQRTDVPEYPYAAVREVITNALLHADYELKGASVQVAVFSDRIEMTNPGGLIFGQTIEGLLHGISRLRNRVISKVFRRLRLVESLGSGVRRIVRSCREAYMRPPLFEEWNNQFRVTLHSPGKVRDWEKQMIDHLQKAKEIPTKDAATIWGVTDRTARTRLKEMLEAKLVERHAESGSDPAALYRLP
jgi:ATP-dependent DNA helicase RecG